MFQSTKRLKLKRFKTAQPFKTKPLVAALNLQLGAFCGPRPNLQRAQRFFFSFPSIPKPPTEGFFLGACPNLQLMGIF